MVDPLSKLPIHAPAICLMGFTAIHIISAGLLEWCSPARSGADLLCWARAS
jgi:hypothetical protein